jgi:hypothetical protein
MQQIIFEIRFSVAEKPFRAFEKDPQLHMSSLTKKIFRPSGKT